MKRVSFRFWWGFSLLGIVTVVCILHQLAVYSIESDLAVALGATLGGTILYCEGERLIKFLLGMFLGGAAMLLVTAEFPYWSLGFVLTFVVLLIHKRPDHRVPDADT